MCAVQTGQIFRYNVHTDTAKECQTCRALKQPEWFTKGKGEREDCRNRKKDKYRSKRSINENMLRGQ